MKPGGVVPRICKALLDQGRYIGEDPIGHACGQPATVERTVEGRPYELCESCYQLLLEEPERVTLGYQETKMTDELEYKGGLQEDWTIKDDRVRTPYATIKFQSGPMKQQGKNGCLVDDILEVVVARLEELELLIPNHNNQMAINAVRDAIECLRLRTADRETRGVEGTVEP